MPEQAVHRLDRSRERMRGASGVVGRDDDRAGPGQQARDQAAAAPQLQEGAAAQMQHERGRTGEGVLIHLDVDSSAADIDPLGLEWVVHRG